MFIIQVLCSLDMVMTTTVTHVTKMTNFACRCLVLAHNVTTKLPFLYITRTVLKIVLLKIVTKYYIIMDEEIGLIVVYTPKYSNTVACLLILSNYSGTICCIAMHLWLYDDKICAVLQMQCLIFQLSVPSVSSQQYSCIYHHSGTILFMFVRTGEWIFQTVRRKVKGQ